MSRKLLGLLLGVAAIAAPYSAYAVDPIRIGGGLQLTGNLATYGNLIKNGIELAAEDLRAEGIPVELHFEDVPFAGAKMVSGFNKLIDADKVDGIGGNFSNVAMATVAGVLEKAKVISFHTAAADPLLLDSGDFVVTTNVRIKDEASAMAEHLFQKLHIKRAAVLSIQTNFGQAYRNFFIERFKALGGEITADETFEIADSDYKAQLLKIRSSNPEAVYGACFGPFLGRALKHGRELGIKAPFFSVYESEDSSVLEAAGQAADGLRYFVTASESTNPKFKEFRKRFLDRFHAEPGTFGSNSYDATMVLGRALHECRRDRECALKKIYALREYAGVSGTFTVESDGATRKGFVLREIRAGKFEDSPN